MPTRSIDGFTGAEDVDITGRIPDGGGVLTPGAEAWNRIAASPGSGTFDIVANPFLGGQNGTEAGNVASIIIRLPVDPPVGAALCLVVFTTNSVARDPTAPAGWTEVHSASGSSRRVVLYGRVCDGTEPDTVTVSMSGAGAAGTGLRGLAFAVDDVTATPFGALGPASTWLASNNLGPVTGFTPDAADSIILLVAAKAAAFTSSPSAAGWLMGHEREAAGGGVVVLYQLQSGGPAAIADATVSDTGGSASGVGFMLEIKRGATTPSCCRHRTPSGTVNWNHYVVKDIPDIGGPGITDYMVEGEWIVRNQNAEWFGVLARHLDIEDTPNETGYELNYQPSNFGEDDVAFAELYYMWEDTYTTLRTVTLAGVAYGESVRLKICVTGPSTDVNIQCWVNDVRIIPDDGTLDPLGIFIHNPPGGQDIVGGWPGACQNSLSDNPSNAGDTGRDGSGMEMVRWRAATACDDEEVPCEGDPDNPYPWEPPPIDPEQYAREWPMQRGAWRVPLVPSQAYSRGAIRTGIATPGLPRKWVMARGAWRPILLFDGETDPDPDTPEPPHHDPCYIYPPILPPGTVIPLTSRFYGLSNTPIGGLSADFFNGTQKALGNWYNDDLPAAVARGAILVGAQGGGSQIKLNGDTWHLATFLDGMRGKLDPLYALLLSYTGSGGFFGVSAADDLASAALWKPSGVPLDEMAFAIATLKSEYPGLRFGCRFRPSQDTYGLGVDFYTAQYTAERGPSYSWAFNEYSLAASRSAYVIMSLNYLHGGDGRSGVRYANNTHKGQSENNWVVSPGEVVEYLGNIFTACEDVDGSAAWLAGSLGYQFHPMLMDESQPGMLAAMLTARNVLAALPPLP